MVNSTADSGPGTLRAAVTAANNGDVVLISPAINGMPIVLTSGEIAITRSIDINGQGIGNSIISGNFNSRIFNVAVGTNNFRLRNMTLRDGVATVGGALRAQQSTITLNRVAFINNEATGNASTEGGGAIYQQLDQLFILPGCRFENNRASGTSGSGGAIFYDDGRTFKISGTTFDGNTAERAGGAIEFTNGATGTASFIDNIFINNDAGTNPGNGGAIHLGNGSDLILRNGSISNNVAGRDGGGLWLGDGKLTVYGTIFSDNVANGNAANEGGGGLYNEGGNMTLRTGTQILSNDAAGTSGSGGGILNAPGGSLIVLNTVISENTASRAGGGIEDISAAGDPFSIRNSVLQGNTTGAAPGNGGGIHLGGGGNLTITESVVDANVAASEGGGIWNGTGKLNVDNSTISNNEAQGATATEGGGGLYNDGGGSISVRNGAVVSGNSATGAAGSGGGIFNGPNSTLKVDNAEISDNTAMRAGGGIEHIGAAGTNFRLTNASVLRNAVVGTPGNGGGVHIGSNGNLFVNGGSINENTATGEGGGIWNGSGILDVVGADIIGNIATGAGLGQGGGGIYNSDGGRTRIKLETRIHNNEASGANGAGGGILNSATGTLTVDDSSINNNRAARSGGGIEDLSSIAFLFRVNTSTLDGNEAYGTPGNGGGIHLANGTSFVIRESTLSSNSAANSGGGIWNGTGKLTVTGTTITNNTSNATTLGEGGGGIYNNSGGNTSIRDASDVSNNTTTGYGGGVLNSSGSTLIVDNSVVSNNKAALGGGGFYDGSSTSTPFQIRNSSVNGNRTTGTAADGGGVYLTTGSLTLLNSFLNANVATGNGGGARNGDVKLVVDNSSISFNVANGTDGGGGIYNNDGGNVSLRSGSNAIGNSAPDAEAAGGAIYNGLVATLTIQNSNVNGNQAGAKGGGIYDNSGSNSPFRIDDSSVSFNTVTESTGTGGGIHIDRNGNLTITNSDVNSNSAGASGGGIWNNTGFLILDNSRINDNDAEGDLSGEGGGAVFNNTNGTLSLRGGTEMIGNTAAGTLGSGGAIYSNTNSTLIVQDAELSSNYAKRAGGAIENVNNGVGQFRITNAVLNNNEADDNPGNGGAIHIGTNGNLFIQDSEVSNNTAGSEGGGIWNADGDLVVDGTTLNFNTAGGDDADQGGGGIYNQGGGLLSLRSGVTMMGNSATGTSGSGGAIFNGAGSNLQVEDAVLNNNTASRAGGAIEQVEPLNSGSYIRDVSMEFNAANGTPGNGGAVHIATGDLQVVRVVIRNNSAASEGGGIWNGDGLLKIFESNFDYNTAGGNDADQGGGGLYNNGSGTIDISRSSTLIGNSATGTSGSGGGIFNGPNAVLLMNRVTLADNTAVRAGGGIEDVSGSGTDFDLFNVNFTGNSVGTNPGNGGAIHITGDGELTYTRGIVTNNLAGSEGGGIWNGTGVMALANLDINNNTASGDAADEGGGGIFNAGGTLTVNGNSKISQNTADGTAGSGGGLLSTGGSVTINRVTLDGNAANRAGGAVEIAGGDYTSIRNLYTNNSAGTAPGNGGAFHATSADGNFLFNFDEVRSNSAGSQGGGLWNQAGSDMRVRFTTVRDNIVDGSGSASIKGGGGIWNNGGTLRIFSATINDNANTTAQADGGGVYATPGSETDTNISTISGNTTTRNGGGIANEGMLSLVNTTIVLNSAATGGGVYNGGAAASTDLTGTIVADNTAASGPEIANGAGSFVSLGYNLIESDDDMTANREGTDIYDEDPELGPLTDNGGITKTHLPACTSPVIDAGDPAVASPDQRGENPFGIRDIGSVELQNNECLGGNNEETALTISGNPNFATEALYPNPVSAHSGGFTTIEISETDLRAGAVRLQLFADGGQLLREVEPNGPSYRLSVSELSPGAYTVRLVSATGTVSQRLVVLP